MDVFQPKMLTRIALIHLEEAVLDVLFKASQEHEGLQPAEIGKLIASRRLSESISNPIVRGILDRLESTGLVRQKNPRDPWELTGKGIENQLAKYHANIRQQTIREKR